MFKRILIANRGEIALRVMRACRDLGIESVAVFSEPDRTAAHVLAADLALPIGPAPAAESYLNTSRLIEAARRVGVQAIHPGYGFLSENARFARAVNEAGLVFIGPSPEAIEQMGDKVAARRLMAAAGVPVVPGSPGLVADEAAVRATIKEIGLPIMLKAAGGGGGKGMRLVEEEKDLGPAIRAVMGEARSAFGDARFYVERFIRQPHHIEFQIFADQTGRTVHLFERECSIQRRNQKVVEESPSPVMTPALRAAMGAIAVKAAQAVNYTGAGTIEFLLDSQRNFYFLEMNTRIQVEHPITELVTGTDLVRAQIEVAAGLPLPFRQEELRQSGWGLECRIYAEDARHDFAPAPGRITRLRLPEGPGVRNDCGVREGGEVSTYYDPMIAKLAVWGSDRAQALSRMRRALGEYEIGGSLHTNLEFHRWLMDHPRFLAGDYDVGFVHDEYHPQPTEPVEPPLLAAALAAALATRRRAHSGPGARAETGSAWKTLSRLQWLQRR
ncbi:MAG TPA: acetyl-CoA carboxylase biotin carboxylase subunit [Candidatus Binataceae bacterium]|nr:acetyl-CoA carboxylase biotin carboxylase subunit [Candidatus Binataceae bacterium]